MGKVIELAKTLARTVTDTKPKSERESPKHPFRFETRRGRYVVEIRRQGIKPIYRRFPADTPDWEAIAWGYAQVKILEDRDNRDLLAVKQREKETLGKITLRTLITDFLEVCDTGPIDTQTGLRKLPGSTIKLRKKMDDVRIFLNAFINHKDNKTMADKPFVGSGCLCQKDFRDYMGRLSDAGMTTSTIKKYTGLLLYVINTYGREYRDLSIPDYLIENGKRLRMPQEINRKARLLTNEEYYKLLVVLNYKMTARTNRSYSMTMPDGSVVTGKLKDDPILPQEDYLSLYGGTFGDVPLSLKAENTWKELGETEAEIEEKLNIKFPTHKYRLVDWQWKLLTDLALETGVRLNGLLKIRWKDIDWSMNRYLQLADKTSPQRTLPLRYVRMMDLEQYRKYIPEQCRHRDHTVFFNTGGPNRLGPLNPDAASNFFRLKIAVRAGLVFTEGDKVGKAYFTFHMLRHTAKVRMRRLGLNGDEINYMTGTKIPDRYLDHWAPEDLNAIQQKLDPNYKYTVDNTKPFVMGKTIIHT